MNNSYYSLSFLSRSSTFAYTHLFNIRTLGVHVCPYMSFLLSLDHTCQNISRSLSLSVLRTVLLIVNDSIFMVTLLRRRSKHERPTDLMREEEERD